MSLFNRNTNVQSTQSIQSQYFNKTGLAVVYHVILDETDELLDKLEIPDNVKPLFIGAIQFRLSKEITKSDEFLPLAVPINQNYTSLPTKNELIRVINSEGGGFFYERLVKSSSPNVSNNPTTISNSIIQDDDTTTKSSDYSNVQSTGIARSTSDSSIKYDGYGDYFEETQNLHYLKLYEGDTLIESRFGQSIRFSGYNNSDNVFSPTITIRNGENPETLTNENAISVEEDINNDGNIIFLGSGQKLMNYTLPTDNLYPSFTTYPSEMRGNQILLNSDRIVLSAKTAEMILVSKKDAGLITDGKFSIDATGGIGVTVDGDTIVNTNNRDVNINSGNGNINLGNQNLESLVRGETLVQLLTELITAIEVMTVATPAGPSSPPINVASFSKVKGQLRTMLSNLNKTS
jgi:hypothetical protein